MEAELVPKKFGYFFVRPNVEQQFTFSTVIPDNISFILARAAFKYENSKDLHTAEGAFDARTTA
ncbi:MAG: hypothetical protein MSG64_19565 [Pyrinomonadaceae bacterium MAG19_C2-C3]|nr:hypothetical protein [Pyrinomonadaceae bacterium MAG19_C2-C3]